MKINSAPAAIVHSLIIQATIMASHPNSLTQVSTNQSPSAYQKPTRYKSTIIQARGKAVFLLEDITSTIIIIIIVIERFATAIFFGLQKI
jgi:hypothetical protein